MIPSSQPPIHSPPPRRPAGCGIPVTAAPFLLSILCFFLLTAGNLLPARAANPETEAGKILGKALSEAVKKGDGAITDPLLKGWVDRVGSQMAAVSPRHDLPYHFGILDTAEPNAFTLPGGYVFVTRGLLDFVTSRDELAGVIGHEVGHVAGRNPMRIIEWQLGASLAVRYGPLPHGPAASAAEQAAVLLATLRFSRQDELQADQYGIRFATEAGYDPAGLMNFLASLGDAGRPSLIQRYLQTHPPTVDRIRALKRTRYLDPRNWRLQETIGDRLMSDCRPTMALPHYENALTAHPGDTGLMSKLAAIREALGQPAPAPGRASRPPEPAPKTRGAETSNASSEYVPGAVAVPTAGNGPEAPAQSALDQSQREVAAQTTHVYRLLKRIQGLESLNYTLHDALPAAAAFRTDDVKWLALGAQAYAEAARTSDLFSRLAQLQSRLDPTVREMASFLGPAGDPGSENTRTAAVRVAAESRDAAAAMGRASGHLEYAVGLLTAVLGDLDSVLLGFNRPVSNIRFATVQTTLIAVNREIDQGMGQAIQSQTTAAAAEDRVLLIAMDRMGQDATPKQLALFDCNVGDLLGVSAAAVTDARQIGGGYGEGVLDLTLSQELGASPAEVEKRYQQWKAFLAQAGTRGAPPDRVDAITQEGGAPDMVEIMLRQAQHAMAEE